MKRLISILAAIAILFPSSAVLAQEETEAAPLVEVVPVVEVPSEEPAPVTDVQVNLITVIIGLLTAFSAGGIMGIAGLSLFVERLNKQTATVTALELLANSWPAATKELLLGISQGLENIGKLGAEVFDSTPIADKEAIPPQETRTMGSEAPA